MYRYIETGGRGEWINQKAVVYKQKVTLKVRLNNKVLARTKLDKTQNNIGWVWAF